MTEEELTEAFDECLNHISCGSNGIEEHLKERAAACAKIALSYTEERVKELKTKEILGDRKIVDLEHDKTVLQSKLSIAVKALEEISSENQPFSCTTARKALSQINTKA